MGAALAARGARVLAALDKRGVTGLVAAHSVTTIYYLLSRHLNRRKARAALVELLNMVQVAAALAAKAAHVITRNPRDFAGLTIPALTSDEFVAAPGKCRFC